MKAVDTFVGLLQGTFCTCCFAADFPVDISAAQQQVLWFTIAAALYGFQ